MDSCTKTYDALSGSEASKACKRAQVVEWSITYDALSGSSDKNYGIEIQIMRFGSFESLQASASRRMKYNRNILHGPYYIA